MLLQKYGSLLQSNTIFLRPASQSAGLFVKKFTSFLYIDWKLFSLYTLYKI